MTVDPMVNEYKPQPLVPYMKSLGIPYWIESDAIVERAKSSMQGNSICSFCSRMKRGMIYNCARREGYNVIAMGQHLDDLAQRLASALISLILPRLLPREVRLLAHIIWRGGPPGIRT